MDIIKEYQQRRVLQGSLLNLIWFRGGTWKDNLIWKDELIWID